MLWRRLFGTPLGSALSSFSSSTAMTLVVYTALMCRSGPGSHLCDLLSPNDSWSRQSVKTGSSKDAPGAPETTTVGTDPPPRRHGRGPRRNSDPVRHAQQRRRRHYRPRQQWPPLSLARVRLRQHLGPGPRRRRGKGAAAAPRRPRPRVARRRRLAVGGRGIGRRLLPRLVGPLPPADHCAPRPQTGAVWPVRHGARGREALRLQEVD